MKYLKKSEYGIKVVDNSTKELKCGMKWYINNLLKEELTNYEARVKTTKSVLSLKTLIPIYVRQNILLFPTTSLRSPNIIFVNYHKVMSIVSRGKTTSIIFDDLTELDLDIGYYRIKSIINQANKLDEYIRLKLSS